MADTPVCLTVNTDKYTNFPSNKTIPKQLHILVHYKTRPWACHFVWWQHEIYRKQQSTSITCLTTKNKIWEIFRRTREDDTNYGRSTTRDYI